MLKDHLAKYYFDGNYNCAESLLHAANEYYALGLEERSMKLVAAYGGGIQCGNTCGAVLSAAAVLAMKYVQAKAHESEEIRPVVNAMMDAVQARFGSVLCRDIKPQVFQQQRRCLTTVEAVCDILEETIATFEAKRQG